LVEGNEDLFLEIVSLLINPGVTCHDECLKVRALAEVGNLLLTISLDLVLTSIEVLELGQAWECLKIGKLVSGDTQSFKASQSAQVGQSSQSVTVKVKLKKLGHSGQTCAVRESVVAHQHSQQLIVTCEVCARLDLVSAEV